MRFSLCRILRRNMYQLTRRKWFKYLYPILTKLLRYFCQPRVMNVFKLVWTHRGFHRLRLWYSDQIEPQNVCQVNSRRLCNESHPSGISTLYLRKLLKLKDARSLKIDQLSRESSFLCLNHMWKKLANVILAFRNGNIKLSNSAL